MIKRKKSIIYYSPAYLKNKKYWNEQEMKTEYKRLRKLVIQSQKRIQKSKEFGWVETRTNFPKARGLQGKQLQMALSDISRYMQFGNISVSKLRQERKQMIAEYGDLGLNKKNYKQFIDWLHANRDTFENAKKMGYESDNIVKMFFESKRLGISFEELNKTVGKKDNRTWMEFFIDDHNMKKLERVERKSGRWVSAKDYAKDIE